MDSAVDEKVLLTPVVLVLRAVMGPFGSWFCFVHVKHPT